MRRLHSRDGRIHVAAATAYIGAQKRLRIVLDLLLHGLIGLAELEYHVRRAGIGSRGHRRHVRRFQQKEACRARPRARRRHIENHRHARAQDCSRHVPHRIHQAAGRVHLDQQRRGAIGVGARNGPIKLPGAHRLDRVIQHELLDQRLLRPAPTRDLKRSQRDEQTEYQEEPTPHAGSHFDPCSFASSRSMACSFRALCLPRSSLLCAQLPQKILRRLAVRDPASALRQHRGWPRPAGLPPDPAAPTQGTHRLKGRSSRAACASLRAPAASPVRSLTSASPSCASATLSSATACLIEPLRLKQQAPRSDNPAPGSTGSALSGPA